MADPVKMVLVPVEATTEMRADGVNAIDAAITAPAKACWAAMLASRPPVGEEVVIAAVAEARRALTGSDVQRLPSDAAFARAILNHLNREGE